MYRECSAYTNASVVRIPDVASTNRQDDAAPYYTDILASTMVVYQTQLDAMAAIVAEQPRLIETYLGGVAAINGTCSSSSDDAYENIAGLSTSLCEPIISKQEANSLYALPRRVVTHPQLTRHIGAAPERSHCTITVPPLPLAAQCGTDSISRTQNWHLQVTRRATTSSPPQASLRRGSMTLQALGEAAMGALKRSREKGSITSDDDEDYNDGCDAALGTARSLLQSARFPFRSEDGVPNTADRLRHRNGPNKRTHCALVNEATKIEFACSDGMVEGEISCKSPQHRASMNSARTDAAGGDTGDQRRTLFSGSTAPSWWSHGIIPAHATRCGGAILQSSMERCCASEKVSLQHEGLPLRECDDDDYGDEADTAHRWMGAAYPDTGVSNSYASADVDADECGARSRSPPQPQPQHRNDDAYVQPTSVFSRSRWTSAEDRTLLDCIHSGTRNWTQISRAWDHECLSRWFSVVWIV